MSNIDTDPARPWLIKTLLPFGMLLGWFPALLGNEIVQQVSELRHLASGTNAFFPAEHFGLLYLWLPLVVLSSFLLFLSPGAILVLAIDKVKNLAEWIVLAFGTCLLLTFVVSTLLKLVFRPPVTLQLMMSAWVLVAILSYAILVIRRRHSTVLRFLSAEAASGRRCFWLLATGFVGVVTLLPKLFWENFNLDGVEAFEFGRSLSTHFMPYWEIQQGVFGFYNNFILFAFPNHWFTTLFGNVEASARLPFILYLIVLFYGLILLIEHRQKRRLSFPEEGGLWLGLLVFATVQAFNTNYEPFFADIAENAATDTLWITCFLLTCYMLWSNRTAWFWIFGIMTYSASPGGLLLLGALFGVTFLVKSPDRQQMLRRLGSVILTCVLIGIAYQTIYSPIFLGGAKNQFSALNLLRRLYPPTLIEFVRVNALLFPSGFLPALSILAVRRKEQYSFVIAGVTIIFFGILYVQVWTSPHQFTPVMALPLVVFWRQFLNARKRLQKWLLPAIAVSAVVCLVLSLPRHFQINLAIRKFGEATEYKIGDYDSNYVSAMQAGWTIESLLPADYRLDYPEQPWGADAPSWIYYATREKPGGTSTNYVIQDQSETAPLGATQVAEKNSVAVYVKDLGKWRLDKQKLPPRVVMSPLYEPILRNAYTFFKSHMLKMRSKETQ